MSCGLLHEPKANRNVPAGGADRAPVVEVTVGTNKAAAAMAAGLRIQHCHLEGALILNKAQDCSPVSFSKVGMENGISRQH